MSTSTLRPQALNQELPARAKNGGFIYVVAFSNSDATVKVGSTSDPRARFAAYRASTEPFGVRITAWWFSPEHLTYEESERTLVRLVEAVGGRKVRNEYFLGVDFDQVVELAGTLGITEVTTTEAQLATERREADSRQRAAQHSAHSAANTQVGLRFTAEHFGMTPEQVMEAVAADPDGAVARWYGDMVEAVRLSRRAARRKGWGQV